jgi:excisionase family DNA binding protein
VAKRGKAIDPEQKYYSPRQAARVLGVSEYLVYQGVKDGTVPHRKLGERILVPVSWVIDPTQN